MHISNPYMDDPAWQWARDRHGPLQIHRDPTLADMECVKCGATWVGQLTDPCAWCISVAENQKAVRVAELLYPSWMVSEGPRYEDLSAIDQAVWKTTRGTKVGKYGPADYVDTIYDAMKAHDITSQQAISAIERLRKWQKKSTLSNDSSQGT